VNAPQVTEAPLLRELSDIAFEKRYGADRFTISVLANRARYVVEHMCTGLLNNAFSPILRDWYDFAATLSGGPTQAYRMSTVSSGLALFFGTMEDALRNTVEEYGVKRLRPGDVLLANDPYRTGNHVNDALFVRPVFVDGEVVSFVSLRAHQLDMGGVVPLGFSGTKRNVYENGLVIGPSLLYSQGEPVAQTFNFVFDNARFCELLFPDMQSIYQALVLGERLILQSIERYGLPAYLGSIDYACDVSAEAMSLAIRDNIPDGVYEAEEGIDCDGIDDSLTYRIKLRITKYGGRVEVDLSGTSSQARTSVNASILDTKTAIGVAFKMLLDNRTPFSSGVFRPIDVIIPPGTFCSAIPPDGAVFMYWESSMPVEHAIFKALGKVLGENSIGGDYGSVMVHNANGLHEDGRPWGTSAECGGEHGPWGATKAADGDSYTVAHLLNNIDPATETIEAGAPVVVLRKEYVADTGGAGFNRGGAAVRKDTMYLRAAEHWSSPVHAQNPAGVGAYGGDDGSLSAVWIFGPEAFDVVQQRALVPTDPDIYRLSQPVAGMLDPDTKVLDPAGEYSYFASSPVWRTQPHTTFRYQTGGGGGWGDPWDRDPERVRRDVRDGYVSISSAAQHYGVVITGDPNRYPERLTVDHAATERLRAEDRSRNTSDE
jgi:N-methylhydantoinase B